MKAMDRIICPLRGTDWQSVLMRCWAGVLLAALLYASACGLASAQTLSQAPPGGTLVADVFPQGLKYVPAQRVMSIIKTRPGQEYQQHVVDEDYRNLYKTGLFGNIRIYWEYTRDNKVNVYYAFVEYQSRIEQIEYKGARHLKKDDLDAASGLRKGASMNPTFNKTACENIVRHYKEKGYLFASCDLIEGGQPNDTRVVFNIAEGYVLKIRDIVFVGNHFVRGARLQTQISSKTPWVPYYLWLGGDYVPELADEDTRRLIAYYNAFGYHDVKVARDVQYRPDFRDVVLTFHVDEGPRYKVGTVKVEGVNQMPRADRPPGQAQARSDL